MTAARFFPPRSVWRATLAAALTVACARAESWDLSGLPRYHPEQTVTGTIRTWGNDAQVDQMKYWEEGFRHFHPQVRFEDHLASTALAIPALCAGIADLGIMGREIWPIEVIAFHRVYGHLPLTIVDSTGTFDVADKTWALVVFVNKDNPISKLTMKQLDGIFGTERTGGWDEQKWEWLPQNGRGPELNVRTWDKLGLTGEWKGQPIHIYGYDVTRNGFGTSMAEMVFHGGDKWCESLKEFAALKKPDGSIVDTPPQVIDAISNDRFGIGWAAKSYGTPRVKPIAVAPGDSANYIEPTKANVQNRSYPLLRSMYIHANREPGKPMDPKVREFLRFILSQEGQQAVAREGDFLPLPADFVRSELRKLD